MWRRGLYHRTDLKVSSGNGKYYDGGMGDNTPRVGTFPFPQSLGRREEDLASSRDGMMRSSLGCDEVNERQNHQGGGGRSLKMLKLI
jgi:hypothetical protein